MSNNEPTEELAEFVNQVKTAYSSSSVLDNVCTLTPVPTTERYGQFLQFAKNLLIERQHITDPSHYLILDEIGTSVARNEIKEIVDNLSRQSPDGYHNGEVSYQNIVDAVISLRERNYRPNHIFLPIEFFHNVFEWNRGVPRSYGGNAGSAFDSLLITNETLKVTYSNKYIPFDNIVITSREAMNWEYRPASDNNERLTVEFNWNNNNPTHTTLLVKEIFNFDPNVDGNLVIKRRPEQTPEDG